MPYPPFAELAVAVHMAATNEARGAEACEIFAARSFTDGDAFAVAAAEVRRQAVALGDAARLLKVLIDHESEVLELIAKKTSIPVIDVAAPISPVEQRRAVGE